MNWLRLSWVVLMVLLAGCAVPCKVEKPPGAIVIQPPPVPAKSGLRLPGEVVVTMPELVPSVPEAVVLPPPTAVTLKWCHPQGPNDAYEIWHSTNMVNWLFLGYTTDKYWHVTELKPVEFFRCRAVNTNFNIKSEWATTTGDCAE